MSFKSLFISFAILLPMAAGLTSCDKQGGELDLAGTDVSFSIKGKAKTKSFSTTGESDINRWCLFLMKDGVIIDRWSGLSEDQVVRTSLDPGVYEVTGVANYPESFNPASIASYDAILNTYTYLEQNQLGHFVMFSEASEFTVANTAVRKEVVMRRMVARVSVDGVAVDFSNRPDLASKSFTLKGIYLINVHNQDRFLEDVYDQPASTASQWYNKMMYQGEKEDLLSDVGINASITPGNPYSVAHYFYPYPNYTAMEASGGTWSARFTRLVIEGAIGEDTRYFSINLAPVKRNCKYHVTLVTIKGFGSGDPDDETDTGEVTVEWGIDIEDWSHGSVSEENPIVDSQSNEGEDIIWDPDGPDW
ncbi:MAG: hypothetical protein J6N54_12635 [Bacteroidales bacterium]|nr:hypothetical protein [Bacteroidales bacterium]